MEPVFVTIGTFDFQLMYLKLCVCMCVCVYISIDLTKEEIFSLSKLCTEDPHFECEFGFFKQNGGTPMGGPLSRC